MKFRMWFKYGLKAQKLQKQHALNQRSPAEGKGKGQKLQKQHALKGQKLLAQGIALGIMAISKAPCFTLIEQALSVFFNVNYI
jgi:hypothetical protein